MASSIKELRTALASYKIGEQVGEGACGHVYRASDDEGVVCAVKVLRKDVASTQKLKRFRNELFFSLQTRDPRIMRVLDYGDVEVQGHRTLFYVMPYYQHTLRQRMKEGLAPLDAARLASNLIEAVGAAHLLKVWHRDLKPENIFWAQDSALLVIGDFGAAHFQEEYLATFVDTAPTTRLANFVYSAPEQRRPGQAVDSRADLYALGVMINEMFTGEIVQGAGVRQIADVSPEHAYFDEVVEWLVQQSPAKRPASVDELQLRLGALSREAVSRQKLSQLTGTVIDSLDPDDPLIQAPPRLISVDVVDNVLHFELSTSVSPKWVIAFQQIDYRNSLMGGSPRDFQFAPANTAKLLLGYNIVTPQTVQQVVDDFKRFLGLAADLYRRRVADERQEKQNKERAALQQRIEAEKKRQALIAGIKI